MVFVESFRVMLLRTLREAFVSERRRISKTLGIRRTEARYTVDLKDLGESCTLFAIR